MTRDDKINVLAFPVILFGAGLVFLGAEGDSPGLGGIGFLVLLSVVAVWTRRVRALYRKQDALAAEDARNGLPADDGPGHGTRFSGWMP